MEPIDDAAVTDATGFTAGAVHAGIKKDGVSLDLCERVTHQLGNVRERYALEVSSPGIERPLTKPAHFRRFLGRRARVRTREQHDGHRSFTGELVGASDEEVTIAASTGVIAIPYTDIHRSNLVEE